MEFHFLPLTISNFAGVKTLLQISLLVYSTTPVLIKANRFSDYFIPILHTTIIACFPLTNFGLRSREHNLIYTRFFCCPLKLLVTLYCYLFEIKKRKTMRKNLYHNIGFFVTKIGFLWSACSHVIKKMKKALFCVG